MYRLRIVGSGMILGTVLVISLVASGAMRHPASIQGAGAGLLRLDIALLFAYGVAGVLVWKPKSPNAVAAATIGAQMGLAVGAVGIANHLIEAFVPVRPFVLVIGPVLLALGLFGAAGAAAWEHTGSLVLAVAGGVYCAIVATLITLCFATSFNLLFAARVDWQLREAFAASGMIDQAGFRVRNILESSSEILVRMPLLAVCLAFLGAVTQGWMSRQGRRSLVRLATFLGPILFLLGATALWYANGIERAARPPFVLSGVLLTGVSLCAAYPIWSATRRERRTVTGAGPKT